MEQQPDYLIIVRKDGGRWIVDEDSEHVLEEFGGEAQELWVCDINVLCLQEEKTC